MSLGMFRIVSNRWIASASINGVLDAMSTRNRGGALLRPSRREFIPDSQRRSTSIACWGSSGSFVTFTHVFPLLSQLKESQRAMQHIAHFVETVAGWSAPDGHPHAPAINTPHTETPCPR